MAEKPFLVKNLSSAALVQTDPETMAIVSMESSTLYFERSSISSPASPSRSSGFIRKRKISTQSTSFNCSCHVGEPRKRIKTDSFNPNLFASQNPSKKGHTVVKQEQESEITQENETDMVSTQLTLFDESWDMDYESSNFFKSDFLGPVIDLSGFQGLVEETEDGVETELKLYEDPWKIKKILTKSDCGNNLYRLMFSKEAIDRHVKPQLKKHGITEEEIEKGINLRVWDYDTETEHVPTFKKWVTNKGYIFGTNWKSQFVDRRELQIGDEIGLFWDDNEFRFGFRVLSWAPPAAPLPVG